MGKNLKDDKLHQVLDQVNKKKITPAMFFSIFLKYCWLIVMFTLGVLTVVLKEIIDWLKV